MKDTILKDPILKDPISKDPISKDPISKDPISKDPISKDPISKDPILKDISLPFFFFKEMGVFQSRNDIFFYVCYCSGSMADMPFSIVFQESLDSNR